MILKITNNCNMGCTHCFHNCLPNGEHMSDENFYLALERIKELNPQVLLVSGGEPTSHPMFEKYIEEIKKLGIVFSVLSNGEFIEKRPELLDLCLYQITNDDRYYPRKIKKVEHKNAIYIDKLIKMESLGRAEGKYESNSIAPNCYNLRVIFKREMNITKTINVMERTLNKFCSILINWNGEINIGELGCCESIGDVSENLGMMEYRLFNSNIRNCNNCGKVKLLTKIHMNQLGE